MLSDSRKGEGKKKGRCTASSALGHMIQSTIPRQSHCLMSCSITATAMQDLTQKMFVGIRVLTSVSTLFLFWNPCYPTLKRLLALILMSTHS